MIVVREEEAYLYRVRGRSEEVVSDRSPTVFHRDTDKHDDFQICSCLRCPRDEILKRIKEKESEREREKKSKREKEKELEKMIRNTIVRTFYWKRTAIKRDNQDRLLLIPVTKTRTKWTQIMVRDNCPIKCQAASFRLCKRYRE